MCGLRHHYVWQQADDASSKLYSTRGAVSYCWPVQQVHPIESPSAEFSSTWPVAAATHQQGGPLRPAAAAAAATVVTASTISPPLD
jgi:hypothetical protein